MKVESDNNSFSMDNNISKMNTLDDKIVNSNINLNENDNGRNYNISENNAVNWNNSEVENESYFMNIDDCCMEYSISDLRNVNLDPVVSSPEEDLSGHDAEYEDGTWNLNESISSLKTDYDENVISELNEAISNMQSYSRIDNFQYKTISRKISKSVLPPFNLNDFRKFRVIGKLAKFTSSTKKYQGKLNTQSDSKVNNFTFKGAGKKKSALPFSQLPDFRSVETRENIESLEEFTQPPTKHQIRSGQAKSNICKIDNFKNETVRKKISKSRLPPFRVDAFRTLETEPVIRSLEEPTSPRTESNNIDASLENDKNKLRDKSAAIVKNNTVTVVLRVQNLIITSDAASLEGQTKKRPKRTLNKYSSSIPETRKANTTVLKIIKNRFKGATLSNATANSKRKQFRKKSNKNVASRKSSKKLLKKPVSSIAKSKKVAIVENDKGRLTGPVLLVKDSSSTSNPRCENIDRLDHSELSSFNKKLNGTDTIDGNRDFAHNMKELRVILVDALASKNAMRKRTGATRDLLKSNEQNKVNVKRKRQMVTIKNKSTVNKRRRIFGNNLPNQVENRENKARRTLRKKQSRYTKDKGNSDVKKQSTILEDCENKQNRNLQTTSGNKESKEKVCDRTTLQEPITGTCRSVNKSRQILQTNTGNPNRKNNKNVNLQDKRVETNAKLKESVDVVCKRKKMRTINKIVPNKSGDSLLKEKDVSKEAAPENKISNRFGRELVVKVLQEDRIFECSHCDYKTPNKYHLSSHWQFQHKRNAKIFKCIRCDFSTKFPNSLNRHMEDVHNTGDEGWLTCPKCKYRTRRKSQLKRHVQHLHQETVKWFTCSECHFRTKWKSHLTLHKLDHDETYKPLKCPHCSDSLKTKYTLSRHIKAKHKSKVLKCEFCSFIACWDTVIIRHVRKMHS